jgi:hypothetical protein
VRPRIPLGEIAKNRVRCRWPGAMDNSGLMFPAAPNNSLKLTRRAGPQQVLVSPANKP